MIVCRKCGRRTPDGTEFCVCGAYLEFEGERVAEPGAGVPAAAPPAAPGSGPTGPLPPPPTTAAQPATTSWTSEPAASRAAAPAEPAPWSGFEPGSAAEPGRPTGGIDAVLPDAPERAAVDASRCGSRPALARATSRAASAARRTGRSASSAGTAACR